MMHAFNRSHRNVGTILVPALLCLLAIALPAQAGSPFYLTAERSFSSTEAPTVRLDYTATEQPMLVRVLRPKNLDRFLEGQLQISRSYEEPLSQLNPGHYFAKGLNRLESPLRGVRGLLAEDFRKTFKDTGFNKAIVATTTRNLVSVPEQVIVSAPAGFEVAKEYYVDLQQGGENTQDLGWWFADNAWGEGRYKVRSLSLAPLPDGVYLLQAVQGKNEAQCLIQVSSLALQVKQSSEQLLVRVIDRAAQPVAGAQVSYRDGRGQWQAFPQPTDAHGEASFNHNGTLDGKLLVKVAAPAQQRGALAATDFLPTVVKDDAVFIVTDRPIFKPGDEFHYKGIVRAFDDGALKMPVFRSKQAAVSVIRSDGGGAGLQASVPLSDFASFSGAFTLDEAQDPGLYRLLAQVDDKPYAGEFRVRDYVKPTFYLELAERSPTVTPGRPFFVKFRAKRYSGGAPQDTQFEVFLYRKKFEAPQWVMEAGAGLSAGVDYHGEVKSAAALAQPQRLFSSIEQRQVEDSANTWESAPALDAEGAGNFRFDVPPEPAGQRQEWIYTLMVRAQDRAGSSAILTDNIYATLAEAQPAAAFSQSIAAVGDKGLKLLLQSSYPDGKPAPRGGGVVDITLEQPGSATASLVKTAFTTDAQGRHELVLPDLAGRGRLTAVATLETLDGKPMSATATSQPAWLVVGGGQDEAVADNRELELYSDRTVLSPGDSVKVLALLPAGWGKGETGTLWQTLAGRKIHQTQAVTAQGRSRWFEVAAQPEYGTGFYHTVTVPLGGGKYQEKTLGFRIVPREKRLDIAIAPDLAVAEPLKPLQIRLQARRSDGSPAAGTELAVSVVDRAVYAVQAEFRPGIFDFFYPLPRINLSTFYSDDLQGYGYADILKKPNFALSALKSQSKLAKKAMRDTAGWFPHVVTDAAGRAMVTVDMPANVTEWLVTAIAADQQGRVGEATGQFKTASDVSVDLLGPQFLRAGEETTVRLKLANHLPRELSLEAGVDLAAGLQSLAADGGAGQKRLELKSKGEALWPLKLAATAAQGNAVLRVALQAPAAVHAGGAEEFEIPLKPAAMAQVFAGTRQGDTLLGELPATAIPRQLRVQVDSGLLGAALHAATVLASYPYGCTEQLVHSTVPNLVLLDLLKRAGLKPEALGPLAPVLARAEKNAALGLKKIVQNQKADGGFGLWPADSEAGVPVTVTALYALKFAAELKIEGAAQAYAKGSAWLDGRLAKPGADSGLAGGYVLARYAELGLYEQPWQQQIAFVEQVRKNPAASMTDLVHALRLFAANRDKSWNRFGQQFNGQPAQKELLARLKAAVAGFDPATAAADGDTELYRALGFGVGLPSELSAALGVLDDLAALTPELEAKLKGVLLSSMANGYWTSTFDTAQVIFNSRSLLGREAAQAAKDKSGGRKIAVYTQDGGKLGELERIPGGYTGSFADPGAAEVLGEIRLEGLKADEAAYTAIEAEVPYPDVVPLIQGLTVERSFRRITAKGSEPLDLSQSSSSPSPALHIGDLIVSEIRVMRAPAAAGSVPSRFLVIEDGIPSFAEGMENDAAYLADARIQPQQDSYWSAIKQTLRYPDRIARAAQIQPGGEFRLYQVWRVAHAGKASIQPARVFDMYDESINGNTGALAIRAE